VPHDNIRRIIAQRLVQAKQTIPHFYLTIVCTIDKLLAAREDINVTAPKGADGKPAWKLSVNDFIIKALALALVKVPDANVTWTESGMLKHKHADVGVAVAAVINPPHATIIAIGAGEERAVVRDGKIVIATQMNVTLSSDHRAVDGALGAELMGAFKLYIESPAAMLV